jgi:hypothetical protein
MTGRSYSIAVPAVSTFETPETTLIEFDIKVLPRGKG